MERRLMDYIDENVEDLKTQLDQLHGRFVTDSADDKGIMQFIKTRFHEMLRTVNQRMQRIQDELNRDLEAALAERLNANKKRSACAAFGDIDDTQRLTDAQRPYPGARGSEMNLESHQVGYNYPFMEFGTRFEIQLDNVQTHLESAVCEMKSGTYKRLAGLDERVGAMEEKMDKII
ncbi:hypothetical protein N5P37_005444 [Trichoderma harzianum]|nr:hypothetical protein N5P37_005444 [Trichoderma harzianum]